MYENFKNLKEKTFVIAEIGSNHQGSVETALELISEAKKNGASAVKFQKRNNKNLFTSELYNANYENDNSYGKTYGLHREALEFNLDQFKVIKDYCTKLDIVFFFFFFDFDSIDFLMKLEVDLFKVASADLMNTPLLNALAKTQKTIILSTGGGTMDDIKRAANEILTINQKLVILHCTASYPVIHSDMNLSVIPKLISEFPDQVIGLSDHENGVHAASIAYMLGARVFEKHFTLNRSWKGTDHSFSLEPIGMGKLTRNLARIPDLLGDGIKRKLESELKPLKKMSKSIVASKNISKGDIIELNMLNYKSPGGGLEPHRNNDLIGKKTLRDIETDGIIDINDVE